MSRFAEWLVNWRLLSTYLLQYPSRGGNIVLLCSLSQSPTRGGTVMCTTLVFTFNVILLCLLLQSPTRGGIVVCTTAVSIPW